MRLSPIWKQLTEYLLMKLLENKGIFQPVSCGNNRTEGFDPMHSYSTVSVAVRVRGQIDSEKEPL
jgi:hypothetical protein